MNDVSHSAPAAATSTEVANPPPTFDVLALSREVRQAVDELGYVHPTPVQRAVFEPASRGGDLVVQARTGTGKTAAFGLPLVDKLVKPEIGAPQALVLSPTRELALQICREVSSLSRHRDLKCTAIYGGAPMQRQIDEIAAGAQIVIGTPGRVLDHLMRGTLDPASIKTVVLDESDEMLSMGFLPQITDILARLPVPRQTLLFSATVPPDVRRIAETRLKDPEFITLSGDHIGALSIQHYVYISHRDKPTELTRIIEIENPESAIVFCNTRDQTKQIAGALQQRGYAADWLNADLAQSDREKVMAATREGKLRFLVATDVAARGIDISHLTHVINADFPESTENYVHRTGRTGRAGRTGTAISLITPQDIGNLYMLKLTYKIFPIERELPSEREEKTRAEADLVNMFADALGARTHHPDDLALARRLLTHEASESIIAGLLRDHLGARPEAPQRAAEARRAKAPRPVRAARAAALPAEGSVVSDQGETGEALDSRPERGRSSRDDRPRGRRDDRPRDDRQRDDRQRDDRQRDDRQRDDRQHDDRQRDDRQRDDRQRDDRPRDDRPRDDRQRDRVAPATEGVEREGANAEAPTEKKRKKERRKKKHSDREADERTDVEGVSDERTDVEAASEERTDVEGASDERTEVEGASDEAPLAPVAAPSQSAHGLETVSASELLATLPPDDEVRIYVSVGRKEGAYREDFEELLLEQGFDDEDILYVKIRERHTFVGVPADLEARAIDVLDGAEICGRKAQAERARPRD